jgi:hypothetical protein
MPTRAQWWQSRQANRSNPTMPRKFNQKILTARAFFREHAGYSHGPNESAAQGRARCAAQLAAAESRAEKLGYAFEWEPDSDIDSSDFSDERPAWGLWVCDCRDENRNLVSSLCGIDFGRDGEPWGDTYARVVQAELAMEALSTTRHRVGGAH